MNQKDSCNRIAQAKLQQSKGDKARGSRMRRYQRKEAGFQQDITVIPLQEIMVTGHQI